MAVVTCVLSAGRHHRQQGRNRAEEAGVGRQLALGEVSAGLFLEQDALSSWRREQGRGLQKIGMHPTDNREETVGARRQLVNQDMGTTKISGRSVEDEFKREDAGEETDGHSSLLPSSRRHANHPAGVMLSPGSSPEAFWGSQTQPLKSAFQHPPQGTLCRTTSAAEVTVLFPSQLFLVHRTAKQDVIALLANVLH